MTFRNYREQSRSVQWGSSQGGNLLIEQINCGSLLRIADAVETMAKSYDNLREDRDYWKARAKEHIASVERLRHSNRALQGVITKLKRKQEQKK